MPVELVEGNQTAALPVHLVRKDRLETVGLPEAAMAWARANGFSGEAGRTLILPGEHGAIAGALFGTGDGENALAVGALARSLPEGDWYFAQDLPQPDLAALALLLGGYSFTRYGKKPGKASRFALPAGADGRHVRDIADGVFRTRDLVNTPTSDMGPAELEEAVRTLAAEHRADVSTISGDDLLIQNFPMIHAVGRASTSAPRLVDMTWGPSDAPKVTLVGKGVCFDTGGLDIKPSSGMLLMKKDMGGAANVLGLASMVMAAKLHVRLRVLIPAVENSIAGNAFRPGDVLRSRKGITVEIGNTDAEGRLVLADALALADDEEPGLLIDMATLTGAARVALGPDLPPFYTGDEALASDIAAASIAVEDPLWRMPLWRPYDAKLNSKIADVNNVTTDGFAGSITAALFLKRFVEKTAGWAHFDIFAWNPSDRPHGPTGGEAQGIRALERVISQRFG
ncbi:MULTISPECIES: leucyl aminopeptidase family protein [unclassified Mesorhizobium]|uniref:leucyl aminopeptidase family protein n=1 Tax=unclassified Mesorhizobium TaxID=325217 RepID=UPI000BB0C2CC|nr:MULTISPECIES: leucyl aminopeptidase family protein [unclassified Mesorhizobium]TGT54154.1 leucyl aminopeptidase family protein [Mesorhizobium sp. M00.F.Ca.ET.170.01.1.1]AZO09863.1 leucyl aminopeptidase family protein [Mesorhizobium sp. M3A.F.Ca.ET.080.04.2.1]PBB86336.1 leucyl aminopeptidase [Mesorhizobium sp. WSM3876]RWE24442.1 MAG: leucyl aminopeptidase family protein [Mesorhizobium sp.]RWE29958.1 MAG: leucyl aminopeptidase family protein [Mesorhizobium sp.]